MLLYHGTSEQHWAKNDDGFTGLYVTDTLEVAQSYADEWKSYQGETPLVLAFELSALQGCAGLTFIPNWETVDQYREGFILPTIQNKSADDLTWSDTLAINGTFCIEGFVETHKVIARKVLLNQPKPVSGASKFSM